MSLDSMLIRMKRQISRCYARSHAKEPGTGTVPLDMSQLFHLEALGYSIVFLETPISGCVSRISSEQSL